MAEPLSVTLSVITLATALKDLLEIADKIKASFAKVSQNSRHAQRLVDELGSVLFQLQGFCDQNYEALNASSEMKIELHTLAMKMTAASETCHMLIPPLTAKKAGFVRQFKAALDLWRKRERVEEELLRLRDDVIECRSRFAMFAIMRMEAKLVELKQSTNARALDILCEISSLRVTQESIYSFAGPSKSLPFSPKTEMAEDVVADMYLRIQVHAISKTISNILAQIPAAQLAREQGVQAEPISFTVDVHMRQDRKILHNETIGLALWIQDLLKSTLAPQLITAGARMLTSLGANLNALKMQKEAIIIGQLAVKVYQGLASVDPMNYSTRLVRGLANLSISYYEAGNLDEALLIIADAVETSRSFQTRHPSPMSKIRLGSVLMQQAWFMGTRNGHESSFEIAREAVMILDNQHRFGIGAFYENIVSLPHTNSEPFKDLPYLVFEYARALDQLSEGLLCKGRIQESLDASRNALKCMRLIHTSRNADLSVELYIAQTLYGLTREELKPCLPRETSLLYVEECIGIYSEYANWHPDRYGYELRDAYHQKAIILGDLGRHEEALKAWKATLELTKKFIRGQSQLSRILDKMSHHLGHLGRHNDIMIWVTAPVDTIIPGDNFATQAYGYGALSVWLHGAGRYPEAIEAGRHAASRYRALSDGDATAFTNDVAYALSHLSQVFVSAELYDDAINENEEALMIYDKLVVNGRVDQHYIKRYMACLLVGVHAASFSKNESQAIRHHQEVLRRCQTFSAQYPEQAGTITAVTKVALCVTLDRFDRLPEAHSVLAELLETWDNTNGPLNKAEAVMLYLYASDCHSRILVDQGCTQAALECLERALMISTPFCAEDSNVASEVADLMSKRVDLLCDLGRYAEALKVGQESRPTLEDSSNHNDKRIFFWNRISTARTLQYHYDRTKEATEIAEVAVILCQRPNFVEKIKKLHFRLSDARQYLAIGLGNRGKKDDALKEAKQAVDEAYKLKPEASEDEYWKQCGELQYMSTRITFSSCLIETGNLIEAIEHLAEVQTYLERSAKVRHKSFVALAGVLRVIGILYCAEGRHQEGTIVADALSSLKTRLGIIIPGIICQIERQAEHDAKRDGAANLRRLKASLTCSHRDQHRNEVNAIYADLG